MPSRQPPDPADPPEMPAATLPPNPHQHRHVRHQALGPLAAALAVVAAISIAAAAVLGFLLYRRIARARARARARAALTAPDDLKPSPPPLRRFTYGQLRRATAGFAPSHRLGQGGFGPVFRGVVNSGQEVAVKLMDAGSLQGEREFQNELALASHMAAVGSPADRAWVVAPLGFCSSEKRRGRWWRRMQPAEDEMEGGRRLLLVYGLMNNGSLQDALLDRRCPDLADWSRRFSVAVDIARGLQFLHAVCDPPVIHGDIKPSNILLDSRLSARIADFGLARLMSSDDVPAAAQLDEEAAVVEIDPDKPVANDVKSGKKTAASPEISREDDVSVMGETAESSTTNGIDEVANHGANGIAAAALKSPEEDEGFATSSPVDTAITLEMASTSEAFDRMSVDSGTASSTRRGDRKKGGVLAGRDWWWRQDGGGEGSSEAGGRIKDYVMEWIRSEIKKERPKSDWITAPAVTTENRLLKLSGRPDRRKQQRRLEWWASLDEEKTTKKESSRPAREWWREEFCEELANKQKRRMIAKSHSSIGTGEHQWWQNDEDSASTPERKKKRRKKKKGGSRTSIDSASGEARTAGRRSSRDWASGDIPRSGTVSSTPSMRGTVCYVAPECGSGGPLSEKCDIYSLGVLLLVLISGRRPLQVTASPMSEFERANLISWARHLAHSGRLMELLDPALRAVNRDQALLCITVALLCIQRSPARRPSIKEVVGMLTGQSEPPHLPLEFSPSPPGGFPFKARRKAR